MFHNGQLDEIDIKILDILQQNARLEVSEIAVKVHRSITPVQERIRKLQERGFIEKYVAVLNRRLLGRPSLWITLVKLTHHSAETLSDFPAYMQRLPEVQVCLQLSGEYDFLLQVTLRDPYDYKAFQDHKLCCLPIVDRIKSSLVLEECKVNMPLPITTV